MKLLSFIVLLFLFKCSNENIKQTPTTDQTQTTSKTTAMISPKYEVILYVRDQQKSRDFYATILQKKPSLDVPGMTEFNLAEGFKLGLMPEKGIQKILLDKTPHPSTGNGIPRCELYIVLGNIEESYNLALNAGAKEVSKIEDRDWGDAVGYVADMDGHIIAFAKHISTKR